MKAQIPWLRVFVEGVALVTLLASLPHTVLGQEPELRTVLEGHERLVHQPLSLPPLCSHSRMLSLRNRIH